MRDKNHQSKVSVVDAAVGVVDLVELCWPAGPMRACGGCPCIGNDLDEVVGLVGLLLTLKGVVVYLGEVAVDLSGCC